MDSSYWSSSDVVAESKLDAMVGNLNHLLDQDYRMVFSMANTVSDFSYSSFQLDVDLDGVNKITRTGAGSFDLKDEDISGLSDGLHIINLELVGTALNWDFRFYKSPEHDRLSMWGKIVFSANQYIDINMSGIIHQSVEGW